MNINSVMHMTNFVAQEINILYSGWSKVFVKNDADNIEIKNRRQRNADFVYILQRQGKTMIFINKIMCCHITTHVNVTSAACLCIFLDAKDHGAERERDVTGLEKGYRRFV
jgi:hypothetical protein